MLLRWLERTATTFRRSLTRRRRRKHALCKRRATRLSVEVLETRDLPDGTVLAHEIYNLVPESYQVSVEVTVSADVPGYEGLYLWQYHVTSGTTIPLGLPLYFNLLFGAGADVANVTSPPGWASSVSAGSGVFWEGTSGSELAPSGDFTFTTTPRESVLIEAGAGAAGLVSLSSEVLGPGENASGENAYQDYLAAVQVANTAHIAAVEQTVIDGNGDINAASQEAQDALDTTYAVYAAAVDDAQADYDAAFAAALQAWVDAFDAAESAHSSASFAAWTAYEQGEATEEDLDAALAAADQAFADAQNQADADYTAAEAAAWDTLTAAEAAAWQTYLDAKAGIEADLTEAVGGIQAAGLAAVEAALLQWEAAEASAWATYLDILANDPAQPAPQERITAPPEVVLQWGEATQPQEPGPQLTMERAEDTPDYPVIDDYPGAPDSGSGADGFTSVDDLKTELSKYAPAKELLDAAIKAGVKIVKNETTPFPGDFDPPTKEIRINPKRTRDVTDAMQVLLYELLRWKYSREQTDLDAKAMAGTITKADYALECEKLTYKYAKEHHDIAAAAVAASKSLSHM